MSTCFFRLFSFHKSFTTTTYTQNVKSLNKMKSKKKTQYYTFWKFIILADEKCQRNIYIDGVMMLHYTCDNKVFSIPDQEKNCPLQGKLLNLKENIWNLRKSNIPIEHLWRTPPICFEWP